MPKKCVCLVQYFLRVMVQIKSCKLSSERTVSSHYLDIFFLLRLNNKECSKQFFVATIRALRNVNGMRKLRTDHWQSLPYQEVMVRPSLLFSIELPF